MNSVQIIISIKSQRCLTIVRHDALGSVLLINTFTVEVLIPTHISVTNNKNKMAA